MDRRSFLTTSLGVSAAVGLHKHLSAAPTRRFHLNYAPHIGMFRYHAGTDPIDQIKFMADQGFRAMEDNGMRSRSLDLQKSIARELQTQNMQMGVFVATGDFANVTFASSEPSAREKILADIRDSVEVAKRVNAKWCTVVPGAFDPGLEWDYQTANVIENLKYCAEICEPSGLVMVLEPLNPFRDHPGLFLSKVPQAFMICKSVDSPSCKILFDIYHQQITEGNLIPNMDYSWSEIGYFQIGDNPGRKEPTTGEINYKNLFEHIHSRGYEGLLGMEHGLSREGIEGEKALIEAYVTCDNFEG